MACLLGCFKRQQRHRFLRAVREGDEESAAATLSQHPALVKSIKLHGRKNALHLAVEEGHLVVLAAVLEVLICEESAGSNGTNGENSARAILNGQDAQGQTPLALACVLGHTECARFLLANGADRSLRDRHGNLPLHIAATHGYIGIMFMLLSNLGAEVADEGSNTSSGINEGNSAGLTPLHLAVWCRQSAAVQVLLQHGADMNVSSTAEALEADPLSLHVACVAGTTPLHLAAARGHVEICKILLKTYYERVLEPLSTQGGAAPTPAAAAALNDPRVQRNRLGQMPYQVAQRMEYGPLAMMLRPTVPLARLFRHDESAARIFGPAPLKIIACEAFNRHLAGTIQKLQQPQAAALSAKQPQQQQQRQGSGRPAPAPLLLPIAELLLDAGEADQQLSPGSAVSPRLVSPSGIPLGAAPPRTPGTPSIAPARSVSRRGLAPTPNAGPSRPASSHSDTAMLPGRVDEEQQVPDDQASPVVTRSAGRDAMVEGAAASQTADALGVADDVDTHLGPSAGSDGSMHACEQSAHVEKRDADQHGHVLLDANGIPDQGLISAVPQQHPMSAEMDPPQHEMGNTEFELGSLPSSTTVGAGQVGAECSALQGKERHGSDCGLEVMAMMQEGPLSGLPEAGRISETGADQEECGVCLENMPSLKVLPCPPCDVWHMRAQDLLRAHPEDLALSVLPVAHPWL